MKIVGCTLDCCSVIFTLFFWKYLGAICEQQILFVLDLEALCGVF